MQFYTGNVMLKQTINFNSNGYFKPEE